MIKGHGIDIVQISRITDKQAFIDKILTSNEEYKNKNHFAGIYAAKEAMLKALGCGISHISFKDISIFNNEMGKPFIVLSDNGMSELNKINGSSIAVSISHEKEYAVASVIIE